MSPLKRAAAAATEQPFVIRQSKIQGRGGYATRDIRKGERLIEYVGQRISWAESDRRYDDTKAKRHHTFLFTVNKRTIIDAAFEGNDARFINHSCDPNCEAIDEKNRIYIHAMRPIKKGEELTYDYSYSRDKNTTEEDEKLYMCKCGSANCRGTILEPPKKKVVRAKPHAASRHAGTRATTSAGTKGRKKGTKAK